MMKVSRIRHKKPITGLPYTPYRETGTGEFALHLWWAFCIHARHGITLKPMKKYIIALFLFLPAVSFASVDTNLKYGARGSEVIKLQTFLISKGFLTGQVTGNFYALTQRAVVQYQSSVNLPTTGFVGAMTREKINAELTTAITTQVPPKENIQITPVAQSKTFTLPNGTVVDANGNVVSYSKETQTQEAPISNIEVKTVSVQEASGSNQQKRGSTELYFSIKNNSNTEAHVSKINVTLGGYGFKLNSDMIVTVNDDKGKTYGLVTMQPSSPGVTSVISIPLAMELSEPIVVYENSQKDLRMRISFTQGSDAEINSANFWNISFSGPTAVSFTAQGLPFNIYPKALQN
jgi:peptidoglycan hydrolase-like protein with peptidoglycan-binding domain